MNNRQRGRAANVSSEDSFINEVTEEVRKDRLYGLAKRYGWIAVAAILILVGGASWNEWRKAQEQAQAELLGDAILSAIDTQSGDIDADALAGIPAEGSAQAIVALLSAAPMDTEEERAISAERLDALALAPDLAPAYRDLAVLKSVMLSGSTLDADARLAKLEPLTIPGAPYRVLAREQMAFVEVDRGNTDAAIEILRELGADEEATQGLRRRASQLIVALGGVPDA